MLRRKSVDLYACVISNSCLMAIALPLEYKKRCYSFSASQVVGFPFSHSDDITNLEIRSKSTFVASFLYWMGVP